MKKCTKCNINKDESKFHKKTKTQLQPICKKCKGAYDKRWYSENTVRREKLKINATKRRIRNVYFMDRYKMYCGCAKCGYKKSKAALEYHHINGKDYNIQDMKTLAISTIKKELRKCIVLCANCHREIHYQ